MQKSQQLFKLIHSLSKSEKRYFRLYSTVGKKDTVYQALFDQILAQAEYQAAPLKACLKEAGIKSSLSRLQNYLYELILKTLANFHQGHHPRYQVMQWIQQYLILRDRGLRQQGKILLKKALKLAQKNNYEGLVTEIVDLMEDWLTEEDDFREAKKQEATLEVLQKENLAAIQRLHQLKSQIYSLRLFFLEHGFIRNAAQKERMQKLVTATRQQLHTTKNPLFERLLLTIQIYCFYALQDFEQLLATEQKRLALLDKSSWSAHISPFLTYAFHRNSLWFALQNKRYQEHENIVNKLPKIFELETVKHSKYYQTKLDIAATVSSFIKDMDTFRFEQAYRTIPKLKALLNDAQELFDIELLTRTAMRSMYVCFCLQKYEESLYWLNFLEQDIPQSSMLPYQNIGKIVHLLIHDGMGNSQLIQNMLASTRIRLYRKQRFFEVATLFVKLFQKMYKNSANKNQKELLIRYKKEMTRIAQAPEKRGFFLLFNFLDWFDSKLQGISIAELLRQRHLTQ